MDMLERPDEPTLNLEMAATDEFGRQPAVCETAAETTRRDDFDIPPQFRNGPHTSHRTDSAHRELLSHPFTTD